ncbi:MAG: 23S rRNA (uracil(1939)-C(5))-methyltransferase RlmD [Bacteroidales bacterium]|nr:23S rRNA (uracil(1939)-C(5))-methyltransferase RlmD [Bacteroidales bacterium]
MGRRNRKGDLPLLEHVTIADAGAEGMAVARVDGLVVFVPFVVPGDVVDIQLYKKKKNYAEGRAVKFHSYSDLRVDPVCPHFGVCGGCKWQTMKYEAQLEAKQRQVRDNLERLGAVDCSGMRPIYGSEQIYYYRNKLEFTFSNRAWKERKEDLVDESSAPQPEWGALGFHIPQLFDKVLPIEHCALQADPSNAIRLAVRDYALEHALPCYDIRNHTGFLRNLVVRCSSTGAWMLIVIVAEDDTARLFPLLDMLRDRFPQITSLQYIINTKLNDSYSDLDVITYSGDDHIEERMEGYNGGRELRFIINPKSFYQTNSRQAQRLYSFVAEMAEIQSDDTIYDLYTGTGTIALFLADKCRRVVGIEYVEEAIADARVNSRLNGFDNTTFYAGDMAKVLTADFIAANGRPDVVVTDPPRAGMHEKVVAQLLEAAPRKIVYVSCNPATQARDLQLLAARYDVRRIQPVDMFPHTQHVENVAELVLR